MDTIKHLEEQLTGMKALVKLNKGLRIIGLGSKKISELDEQINELEMTLKELKETPLLFNKYFSD